jgi:hypothetical protein
MDPWVSLGSFTSAPLDERQPKVKQKMPTKSPVAATLRW